MRYDNAFKERRPEWEIRCEREFIHAANRLKTPPGELGDQIIAARGES